MSARGFTVLELVIALALGAVVTAASYRMLDGARGGYAAQSARVVRNQELRAAVWILSSELRDLEPSDPDGSDIVAMTPASVTYRATRGLRFLCAAPDTIGLSIALADGPNLGALTVSAEPKALRLHARNKWLRATATGRAQGLVCAGNRPGTVVRLADIAAAELGAIESGAPVRITELVSVQSYRDGDGVHWIGARTWSSNSSWSDLQPFAGPITAGGLEFQYLDRQGNPTGVPAMVARIGISVAGRAGNQPVFRLETQVAPRNRAGS